MLDDALKTLGCVVVMIFVTALITHCANAVELVEGAQQKIENKAYAKESIFHAAQEAAKEEPTEVMWPAEHDQRFWLPEEEWRKVYCAKHKAGACDE